MSSCYLPAGVRNREVELSQLLSENIERCAYCEREFDTYDNGVVEVQRAKTRNLYFCNLACRANQVFDETKTATGKAALKRLVAALHLLIDEDVTALAPALEAYEADAVTELLHTSSITQLREDAMALLGVLSPDESVAWATEAQDAAAAFGERLGRGESAKPASVPVKLLEVAHA